MKTKIFILIAVLFSSVSLFSQQRGTIVYNNVENSEFYSKKECIAVDKATLVPLKKVVSFFDENGRTITKTTYKWNSGWFATKNTDYQYNEDNQVASMIYTEWNKDANAWSDKSECSIYTYGNDGEWLAMDTIQLDNSVTNMLTQK